MGGSPEQWRRWERTRARGERSFVWRVGVLGWGGGMAALWCGRYAVDPGARPPWWLEVPFAVAVFPAGGYWWGKWMWRYLEGRYRSAGRGGPPAPPAESGRGPTGE